MELISDTVAYARAHTHIHQAFKWSAFDDHGDDDVQLCDYEGICVHICMCRLLPDLLASSFLFFWNSMESTDTRTHVRARLRCEKQKKSNKMLSLVFDIVSAVIGITKCLLSTPSAKFNAIKNNNKKYILFNEFRRLLFLVLRDSVSVLLYFYFVFLVCPLMIGCVCVFIVEHKIIKC